MASFGAVLILIVARADWPGSATLVATSVTVAGEGALAGAVYNPPLETVPQVEPLHPVPESVQRTDVLVLPVTVAENCCCPPVTTRAVDGSTLTETEEADWMTTVAELDFVGSATEVAVTVARDGLGMVAGAV